jgi:hypothetical protein
MEAIQSPLYRFSGIIDTGQATDAHYFSTVVVDSNEYLVLAGSCHQNQCKYKESASGAYDSIVVGNSNITGGGADGGTYVQLSVDSNDNIFGTYRITNTGDDSQAGIIRMQGAAGSRTFDASIHCTNCDTTDCTDGVGCNLIDFPDGAGGAGWRIYQTSFMDANDKLHIAFHVNDAGGAGPDKHEGLFYLQYDYATHAGTGDNGFYHADGSTPVDPDTNGSVGFGCELPGTTWSDCDVDEVAVPTGAPDNGNTDGYFVCDVGADSSSNPYILANWADSDDVATFTRNGEMRLFYYSGGTWSYVTVYDGYGTEGDGRGRCKGNATLRVTATELIVYLIADSDGDGFDELYRVVVNKSTMVVGSPVLIWPATLSDDDSSINAVSTVRQSDGPEIAVWGAGLSESTGSLWYYDHDKDRSFSETWTKVGSLWGQKLSGGSYWFRGGDDEGGADQGYVYADETKHWAYGPDVGTLPTNWRLQYWSSIDVNIGATATNTWIFPEFTEDNAGTPQSDQAVLNNGGDAMGTFLLQLAGGGADDFQLRGRDILNGAGGSGGATQFPDGADDWWIDCTVRGTTMDIHAWTDPELSAGEKDIDDYVLETGINVDRLTVSFRGGAVNNWFNMELHNLLISKTTNPECSYGNWFAEEDDGFIVTIASDSTTSGNLLIDIGLGL